MGCQQDIVDTILEQKADYMIAVKQNQKFLYQDIVRLFSDKTLKSQSASTTARDHGRTEQRICDVIDDPIGLNAIRRPDHWHGLKSVVRITAKRQIKGQKTSIEFRYYISSLRAVTTDDAKKALQATRSHWGVENSLHWVLDIAFREDESRVRKGYAAENFAVLRHLALNLLKQDTTTRAGIKARRLKTGWDIRPLLKPHLEVSPHPS